MKRNVKKALAFALATVTVAANIGVTAPVTAAEYEGVKDVLPTEYESYDFFDDGMFFINRTEVEQENAPSKYYVNDLVFVDKDGNTSTMEVKNTDGSYKYNNVSWVSDDCLAMIYDDYSYSLYYSDGTTFGSATNSYDDIVILEDGNYIVVKDSACNIVDKTGKVIVKDVFSPVEDAGVYWWPCTLFGDNMVIGRQVYTEDGEVRELKIFDKDYKEVTTIDLEGLDGNIIKDKYLALTDGQTVSLYDNTLKKLDFTFKLDIVVNPSISTDAEPVLTEYRITNMWSSSYGELEYMVIVANCTYEDIYGNQTSNYEYFQYDINTLRELTDEDFYDSSESEEDKNDVANTDVSYKYENSIIQFYLGDTKIFSMDEIIEYMQAKVEDDEDVGLGSFVGVSGNLFMDIMVWSDEQPDIKNYTLMLSKADNYDITKATLYEKEMYDWWRDFFDGYVKFADGTSYFDGKWYEKGTEIQWFWTYNYDLDKPVIRYYIIGIEKDDSYSATIYDKDKVEVAKIAEKVNYISENGFVVTIKNVKAEDGDYTYCLYGCKYIQKKLVSSEDVIEELGKVEEGESVEVEVKKNEPIKATVFEAIKGKDVNVVVKTPSGMTWTINGKDVTGDKFTDIDFTAEIVSDVVPTDAISKIKLDGEKVELTLSHNGDFGFKATLSMSLKAENSGKYANLFYYNPTTKELEFQEAVKVDANGNAGFRFTHASDYVIYLSDVAYSAETTPTTPTTPITADMANVGMLIAILAVAAGAVVIMQKKRISVK